MFTPFAFVKGEAAVSRTDIPPYDPYVYYDATNTTYSSADYLKDVVSLGAEPFKNFTEKSGTPGYVSGEYWDITQLPVYQNYYISSSIPNTDFLVTMGFKEHTIIILHYPTSLAEGDIIANNGLSTGAVLAMVYDNRFRGHAFTGTTTVVTDSSNTLTVDAWQFGAQRLTFTGVGNCRLDVFEDLVGNLPPTKTTGSSETYNTGSTTGPTPLVIASRDINQGKYYGDIAQIAIYDYPLSDSEVNDVMDYMKTRSGL